MIELAYIVGTAMAVVNTFKSKLPSKVVPLVAVAIAITMNVCAAYLFGYDPLTAARDAFVGAGIVVGLFASNDTQSNRTQKLIENSDSAIMYLPQVAEVSPPVATIPATPKESETPASNI